MSQLLASEGHRRGGRPGGPGGGRPPRPAALAPRPNDPEDCSIHPAAAPPELREALSRSPAELVLGDFGLSLRIATGRGDETVALEVGAGPPPLGRPSAGLPASCVPTCWSRCARISRLVRTAAGRALCCSAGYVARGGKGQAAARGGKLRPAVACRHRCTYRPCTLHQPFLSPHLQEMVTDIADIADMDQLPLLRYYVTPQQWRDFTSGGWGASSACQPALRLAACPPPPGGGPPPPRAPGAICCRLGAAKAKTPWQDSPSEAPLEPHCPLRGGSPPQRIFLTPPSPPPTPPPTHTHPPTYAHTR